MQYPPTMPPPAETLDGPRANIMAILAAISQRDDAPDHDPVVLPEALTFPNEHIQIGTEGRRGYMRFGNLDSYDAYLRAEHYWQTIRFAKWIAVVVMLSQIDLIAVLAILSTW